jgi:hypothetical protein
LTIVEKNAPAENVEKDDAQKDDENTAVADDVSVDVSVDDSVGRIIKGQVRGSGGALQAATLAITFSVSDLEKPEATDIMHSVTVKKMTIATDAEGNYQIKVPSKLALDRAVRVEAQISKAGYLTRSIGPVPLTDFDKRSFANDEAHWLHRQLAQSQFKTARLKKAKRLAGRVLLPNGKPAVGAEVAVSSKYKAYSWKFHNADEYGARETQITNEEGEFTANHEDWATLAVMLEGEATLLIDNLRTYLEAPDPNGVIEFQIPRGHIASPSKKS